MIKASPALAGARALCEALYVHCVTYSSHTVGGFLVLTPSIDIKA